MADSDARRPKLQAMLGKIPRRERETRVYTGELDSELDFGARHSKFGGPSDLCIVESVVQKSPDIHLDPYVHGATLCTVAKSPRHPLRMLPDVVLSVYLRNPTQPPPRLDSLRFEGVRTEKMGAVWGCCKGACD